MGWIAGWNKRIKLTISGSCIDGDLDNFPIMVHLDTTCSGVFNELGSNSKRISMVTSDQQQCYVEVEWWDESTNNAWLWVNVPTLASGIDFDLYLYYDNLRPDNSAYIGMVGEIPAKNVWDENFVGVWHMNQDPSGGTGCILNSTSFSGLDGTPGGSMTSGDLIDGKVGKALDFDGTDDRIVIGDAAELRGMAAITVETILKVTSKGNYEKVLDFTASVSQNMDRKYRFMFDAETDQGLLFGLWDSSNVSIGTVTTTTFPTGSNCFIAGVYTGVSDADTVKIYKNETLDATGAGTGSDVSNISAGDLWVGGEQWSPPRNPYHGMADEIRISNIARSAFWIKATYHSNFDQLVGYGDEEIVSSGFLPGWNNRLKLTIQNDHIDNTLTDFPVMVHLSDSSGFNSYDNRSVFYELEVNINRKKIAITDSTGTLQCFVEIERFSCAETEAVLWIKLPVIYADVGTCFYLYYDKTQADNISFIGDVNSIVAQNVWDSNFVGVWHMNQDPSGGSDCIKDSTSNTNHSTPAGSMVSGNLVDGKIGKALDFDGSDDYLDRTDNAFLSITGALTLESTFKTDLASFTHNKGLVAKYTGAGDKRSYALLLNYSSDNNNPKLQAVVSLDGTAGAAKAVNGSTVIGAVSTYYGASVFTSSTKLEVFLNGSSDGSSVAGIPAAIDDNASALWIGAQWGTGSNEVFDGIIDETRISNTARSAPWIKATYYSNLDSLVIFEKEDITASWLDYWAKRIRLTIDQTKIDSSLTGFPILVTLTSGVQSDFFDELNYGSVNDVFTGVNGSAPNSDRWTSVSNCEIQSNKLRFPLSSVYASCSSVWRFDSDFDIQIDFDLITYPSVNYWWADIQARFSNGDFFWMCRAYKDGTHQYIAQRKISGAYTVIGNTGTSDTSGKLRIVRTGTNYSFYYYNAGWIQLGSSYSYSTEIQCKVKLEHNVGGSSPECSHDFDNFTVTSGTVIWPQDTHPNRKKIAVTTNDGITKCPVEIEQFDTTSGTVNLWTKLPLISYSSDTDVYLYYDKTKEDNTDYVGDTGSTPAQNVWDENFVGVWHMNQDPTGGSGCIKDSTGNNNDGTPAGSMTSGDLVDGKIDKALDFDGSNDLINYGSASGIDNVSIKTIESIIYPTDLGGIDYGRIVSKQDSSVGWGFMLRGPDDAVQFYQTFDGTNGSWRSEVSSLTINQWQYVACFYDLSNVANNPTIFVNDDIQVAVEIGIPVGTADSDASIDLTVGDRSTSSSASTRFNGKVDETRISNIARSASWIKATYYSNWNTLLTYGSAQGYTPPPDYYYHGYVKEKGVYVARKVYLYRRDTGVFIDSCMSNADTGYYLLETSVSGEHFVVALDNDVGDDYNALVQDRIYPNGM